MLMKCQKNQRKVTWLKNGALEQTNHSTFNQLYQKEDILIYHTVLEILPSRLSMAEALSNGTSITNQGPSSQCKIVVGLGTSKMLVDLQTCRFTTPTLDGSNSSDGMKKKEPSTMFTTKRYLMLQEVETKKVTTFRSSNQMVLQLRNGNLFTQIARMLRNLVRTLERSPRTLESNQTSHSSSSQKCLNQKLSQLLVLEA
jgi:hypothetical protein